MHCQLERGIVEIQKEAITYRSYVFALISTAEMIYIIPIVLQAVALEY